MFSNHNVALKEPTPLYQPGQMLKFIILSHDAWNYHCYCSEPPAEDCENCPAMAQCDSCKITWEHVNCYGFKDVDENNRDVWDRCAFLCTQCSGADPSNSPDPNALQPTSPTTQITSINRGIIVSDGNENERNGKDGDENDANDNDGNDHDGTDDDGNDG